MNRNKINHLKEKILLGLKNLSKISYSGNKNNFYAFLNTYIFLATRLNQSYIDQPSKLLKSLTQRVDFPNIINILNGISELGFTAKLRKGCRNINKIVLPCLCAKGHLVENNEIKILFRENNQIISYNPYDDSFEKYNKNYIENTYNVYTFEQFDEERHDLSKGVLKFLDRSWFIALLARFKYVISKLVLVSIILNLFSLAIPLYIIYIYDRVLVSQDTSNILLITNAVIFLLLCEQILRYFRSSVLSWLGGRVDYIVTNEVLNKINRLPLSTIEKISLPSQIARIKSFSSLRDFFTGPIFSTLLELPAIILMIVLISFIHYAFTIIFLFEFALLIICLFIFHRILVAQIKKSTFLNTEKYYLTSIFLEKVNNLHYQGLEKYYLDKSESLSEKVTYHNILSDLSSGFVDNYGKFLSNIGILLTLAVGIYLVWNNEVNIAALLATVFLAWRIFSPIQVASSTLVRSEKLFKTIKQIDDFLSLPDEQDNKNFTKNVNIEGHVRLSNVGVFYGSSKKFVLRNFSMNIQPKTLTVLTGESGTGKSTILKLIAFCIKPNIGKILIDKYDINQLNLDSLRSQICYIHQTEHVIPGTIYENIQIVNPFLTKNDIDKIFDHLALTDAFSKLTNGLETYITNDDYHQVSRKILKCIGIARLYSNEAPIKLIDGLNKEVFGSEVWNILLDDIRKWKKTNTIIIVSDEQTLHEIADDVIYMKPSKQPMELRHV